MQRVTQKPVSFDERIAAERRRLEAQAAREKHGPARDALLQKLRQLEVAADLNEWLSSPALRPPR